MVEVEEFDEYVPAARNERLRWLLSIWYAPARTLQTILREERAVWLIPLLLLSLLALANVFAAGPLRQAAAANAVIEPPPGFEWMSPEQQEQYMQAQASASGPVQVYVFPAIGALSGVWVRWFVLGAVLHLAMTMLGSRGTSTSAYNLTAWASMPFVVRGVVQLVAMLAGRALIANPGLSGFLPQDAAGGLLFARLLLAAIDIYLIWQIVLLWIGARASGLPRGKALAGVLISVLLLVAVGAGLQFLVAQVAGLSVNGPMFLF
jgi:hypothetical protein